MAYHLSPNGPSLCKAKKGRCPYGQNGENHFDSIAEAGEAFETRMREAFGGFEGVKKSQSQKQKENLYKIRDKAVFASYTVKASAPVQQSVKAISAIKETPVKAIAAVYAAQDKAFKAFSKVVAFKNAVKLEAKESAARIRANYASFVKKAEEDLVRRATIAQDKLLERKIKSTRKSMLESSMGGKLKTRNASTIQVGDKFINGMSVTRVKTVNGNVVIGTRDPSTGRFGKSFTLAPTDSFEIVRQKGELSRKISQKAVYARNAAMKRARVAASNATLQTRGAFNTAKNRVKQAAQLQRESYYALRGVNRSLAAIQTNEQQNPVANIRAIKSFDLAA